MYFGVTGADTCVCQNELEWLDMTINVKKSVCMRIGARCEVDCVNIVTTSKVPDP